MSDYTNVEDLLNCGLPEFTAMWNLTIDEVRRESITGRLQVYGRGPQTPLITADQIRISLPSMRNWVARKRTMPAAIRTKVEAAGGLDRVEQFRFDQIRQCRFDIAGNRIILPDGSVVYDVQIKRSIGH